MATKALDQCSTLTIAVQELLDQVTIITYDEDVYWNRHKKSTCSKIKRVNIEN